ncbi:uncharacterized protein LOC111632534 [Centruroides sculpturatus]|uniref:uncharacterized protein LOC111632534 n=1 Tax=Centruroides sculpturatus TaxID=218467 RepID=UPI000C6EF8ED|nr:uncharacterized protein LOC111632534 [Centruroides sculpturatus]
MFTAKDRQKLWQEIADRLNSDGVGSQKDPEKWRKTWSDWKANIKSKASQIKKSSFQTGGGPSLNQKLTEVEERVLNLIGITAVYGESQIDEAGVQEPNGAQELSESAQDLLNCMIDNTISCVQSNNSTCINEEYPSNQNTYFELPPNADCNPTDGLHLNTSLRNVNRKKRKHEKSVGECMAESLNRTEDEKLHILKNIQQAMNEIAKNIERKS